MSEVSSKPLAEDWEQAEEALNQLEIKDTESDAVQTEQKAGDESGDKEPSSTTNVAPDMPTSQSPNDGAQYIVDHALRDALARHKHRNSVLRLEAEIEAFVVNSSHPHRLFSGDMSSYDRLLTHRTAQHWGLDTSTVSQGPDQGCILAVRTPRTGPPPIKLAVLPVTMEEPLIPPQQAPLVGSGGGGGGIGNGGAQPKVLVRRRTDRPNGSPGGGGGGAGQQGFNSRMPPIEDRELHYERARARIFGDGDGGDEEMMNGGASSYPPPPPQIQMQQKQQQQQRRDNNTYHHRSSTSPATKVNSPQQSGGGGALPPPPPQQQQPQNNNNNYNNQGGKAQLRNRQEDLSDPDFRRGRHAGYGNAPRFDPGYGDDYYLPNNAAGSMYITARPPTYSSEFPELGGGGGGRNYPQMMPSAGGGMAHHHPLHYAPYAAYPGPPGQSPLMLGGNNINGNRGGVDVHHLQQQQQQHRQMAALHHHHQQQYHQHAVPPPGAGGAIPPQYAMTMTPYGYMPYQEASGMVPMMYPSNGGEMPNAATAVDGIPYLPSTHHQGSNNGGGVVVGSPSGMVNNSGVNMGVQRGNGGGGGGRATVGQQHQQRPQHQQQQQPQRNSGPNKNTSTAAVAVATGGKGNKSGGVNEKSSADGAPLAAPEK